MGRNYLGRLAVLAIFPCVVSAVSIEASAEDAQHPATAAEGEAAEEIQPGEAPTAATTSVEESPAEVQPAPAEEPAATPTAIATPFTVVAPAPAPAPVPESTESPTQPEESSRRRVETDPDRPGTLLIGDLTFAPMVEVRFRGEVRASPYTASGQGANQYFVGSRARLGLDLSYRWIRGVALFQDARSFGQFGVGTDGGSTTGLHLGFIELRRGSDLWLRLGRQEINYGAQRMLGALNWSTAGRSFDALRLHAHTGSIDIDALAAMVRMPRTVSYTDAEGEAVAAESEGDWLAAVSLAFAAHQAFNLEVQLLYRHDGPTDPAAGADPAAAVGRERDIASPGIRLHGAPVPGLRYDVEFHFQGGRSAGERHLALAVTAETSYALQVRGHPGLALGAAYATGGLPGDDLNEFDNFFPTNHLYYGAADLIGLRNVIEFHAKLFAAPEEVRLRPSISFHLLALDDPSRPWKNAGGRLLGVSADNDERVLGYEIDVNLAWRATSWLSIAGGYAVFIPAAGVENLGHNEATHWAYLMIGSVLP